MKKLVNLIMVISVFVVTGCATTPAPIESPQQPRCETQDRPDNLLGDICAAKPKKYYPVTKACRDFTVPSKLGYDVIMNDMEWADKTIEQVLTSPECRSQNVADGVKITVFQIAAENTYTFPTFRRFKEDLPKDVFLKALNTKNTIGHNFLDHMFYQRESGMIADDYVDKFNVIIKEMCDYGAQFSVEKYKKTNCVLK